MGKPDQTSDIKPEKSSSNPSQEPGSDRPEGEGDGGGETETEPQKPSSNPSQEPGSDKGD